jgi:UDP-N-acetylmuramoyl-tripeptide--D-alanyl-D-alanine ligase
MKMIPCTLEDIARKTTGVLRQGLPELRITRLHTDTRTLRAGDCFVALAGDRFDGHEFLEPARKAGAVAALIAKDLPAPLPSDFGLVRVQDTLEALQRFSADYRRSLSVKVVGVTGSSGKTTTKEMIASVLGQKFRTRATQGNLNNHIGVPLTLLQLERDDEMAVVEMGMNHPGEIAPLARLSAPDLGVLTNVGTAHLGFFKNQEAVAHEKAELMAALSPNGVAILNADDAWTDLVRGRTSARVVLAGLSEKAEWRGENIAIQPQGTTFDLVHGAEREQVALPFFSRILVNNALLAAAVGGVCGLTLPEIARGLAAVTLPGARLQVLPLDQGWLINDAYNANPDSMRAALTMLREFPAAGRRVAILGSMGELGEQATELHFQVGRMAAQNGASWLIAVGPQAQSLAAGAKEKGLTQIDVVAEAKEALAVFQEKREATDCVLVKGSRFMKLETIGQAFSGGGKA